MKPNSTATIPFTSYQKFAIFILAVTQFSVILDFMVMSPMGNMLMRSLSLKTEQFGMAVSAYAYSAGIAGLLTAGFADKFDRKKLLVFFYSGFILGTLCCGLANSYHFLIAARMVTGLFGGVIGSISMAIIADLFDIHHRGRVMGFIQMAFGASQVLGIPISLYISGYLGWHAPFLMIVGIALIVMCLIIVKLQPVTKHLEVKNERNPIAHLVYTLINPSYAVGFLATALLSIGGFMMMPFGTPFAINNLHVDEFKQIPLLFMISGVSTLIIMPVMGRFSDKIDKFLLFALASVWMITVVLVYTNLTSAPFWMIVIFNVLMMIGVMTRMVPASALTSSLPEMKDRGAYMSISSSLQQIAGGIGATIAGHIVFQPAKGMPLQHYNTLGYVVVCISVACILMVYRVNLIVKRRLAEKVL